MIAIDLSKQQTLDADPKAIQQINFSANLDQGGKRKMFFIMEEVKKTLQIFHNELRKCCYFNLFYCNISIKSLNITL